MTEFSNDKFIIESDGWTFEDSIVMPIEDYNALTQQEIEDMKIERFKNYRELITHPVQPAEELIPESPVIDELAQLEEVLIA